jgi:hypothetical protein
LGYDFVFSTWAFSASASCFLGIAEAMSWTLLANGCVWGGRARLILL